eukprot:2198600-Rhodomonas_salina.1
MGLLAKTVRCAVLRSRVQCARPTSSRARRRLGARQVADPTSLRAATRCPVPTGAISLRACYAMPGTDIVLVLPAYARATRCPVLTSRMVQAIDPVLQTPSLGCQVNSATSLCGVWY